MRAKKIILRRADITDCVYKLSQDVKSVVTNNLINHRFVQLEHKPSGRRSANGMEIWECGDPIYTMKDLDPRDLTDKQLADCVVELLFKRGIKINGIGPARLRQIKDRMKRINAEGWPE